MFLNTLQGASTVHFQDLNAETIRCTTIPNVLANLELAIDRQSHQPESPLTPSRQPLAPTVHFYAGEWEELPLVLSVVKNDVPEVPTGMSLSFSEEDFNDGCSSQDGSILGRDPSSRQSRKLSGSRAWERASETDQGEEGGYDVILLTEIPYSVTSMKKVYALIKKVTCSFFLSFQSKCDMRCKFNTMPLWLSISLVIQRARIALCSNLYKLIEVNTCEEQLKIKYLRV